MTQIQTIITVEMNQKIIKNMSLHLGTIIFLYTNKLTLKNENKSKKLSFKVY